MTGRTTLAQAKDLARGYGYALTFRDGEYRVAPTSGTPAEREAMAYYTNDRQDAIDTARAMALQADPALASDPRYVLIG